MKKQLPNLQNRNLIIRCSFVFYSEHLLERSAGMYSRFSGCSKFGGWVQTLFSWRGYWKHPVYMHQIPISLRFILELIFHMVRRKIKERIDNATYAFFFVKHVYIYIYIYIYMCVCVCVCVWECVCECSQFLWKECGDTIFKQIFATV